MNSRITIDIRDTHISIIGRPCVSLYSGLLRIIDDEYPEFDLVDLELAEAYNAVAVLTNEKNSERLRKELPAYKVKKKQAILRVF